jgi:hypothetical protein
MCPVAATFIGLIVAGAIAVLGLPIFINMWDSGKQWLKNRPGTSSFGPGANVRRCNCDKINFGGGPG